MKKYILLLLSFLSLNAFGNSEISQYIPTPNSASIGSYGVVPVSMYTGKPEISIPLHTLNFRGFSLPISLNYDGSGVKVNDMPGWVGSGWSLNAGGVITRSVRGTIDEKHSKQLYMDYETLANYRKAKNYDPNYFSNFEIEYGDYLGRYGDHYPRGYTLDKDAAIANGDLDRCSDVYYFNFLNYSGCFFFNGNDWIVKSESNLEIIFDCKDRSNYIAPFISKFYNGSDMYETIKGFTIRDENGYSYIFGGTTDAIEYTTPFFDMGQWDAMSWYLTSIVDKFGYELYEFQYERGKFLAQVYENVVQDSEASNYLKNNPGSRVTNHSDKLQLSINFNAPVYLSKIITCNGAIEGIFESCDNEDESEYGDEAMAFNQLYGAMFSRYPINNYSTYYACLKEFATHDYDSYDFIRMKDTPFVYLQREYYERTKQDDIWTKCVYIPAKYRHYYSGKVYSDNVNFDYYSEFGKKYYVDKESIIYDTDILSRTRPRKLYRIKFIDYLNYGIQYDLKYNYSGRMHLSNISISNPKDPTDYRYKPTKIGEYNLKYDHFGEIPYDLLVSSDAWGYYSGVDYQDLSDKNYKKANPYYVTLGSLKEIQYPTGGTTEFEFESNQFSRYLHEDKNMVIDCENDYGGGLRIASITNWDSPSHDKMISKKTYKYTFPNSKSTGIINNLPIFEWRNWTYPNNKTCSFNIIRSCPIIPLVNSFSPCVGYSCVKEINADSSYTINWYSDMSNPKLRDERYFSDYTGSSEATPFDVYYTDKSYLRGKLLLSRIYNSNNELVKSTGYTYRPLEEVLNTYVSMDGIKIRQWAETYQYFVETNKNYDFFHI